MSLSNHQIMKLLGITRKRPDRRLHAKINFLRDAALSQSDACIDWPFSRNPERGDYGMLCVAESGKPGSLMAHRSALSVKLNRQLLDGEQAQHTCDRPCCVNGKHLIPGSHSQNMRDAFARGQMKCFLPFGVKHHSARLNPAKVKSIRAQYATGRFTYADLASEFGVTNSAIWKILHGHSWKKVE